MKTLFLVRHAKSSWEVPGLTDFERPLNERGKRDAPMMADRLHSRGIPIELFVSSPAKRAYKTAQAFARAYGKDRSEILLRSELYMADVETFFRVIGDFDDRFPHAAVFSHNNGISEFANALGVATIDVMPTCSIFAVSCQTETWRRFRAAPRRFWFFDYPRNPVVPEYGPKP